KISGAKNEEVIRIRSMGAANRADPAKIEQQDAKQGITHSKSSDEKNNGNKKTANSECNQPSSAQPGWTLNWRLVISSTRFLGKPREVAATQPV
ncbi:MAG: hypothetical protein ACR2NM_01815, partial [Bythopirellula sp.]